ncbi:hypothetical protein EVG20_g8653 [Dentipellis fragilis]|uniref:F-box domain-containing protein n=1 Tax=Dentipellis fragilis TaxID=205917 RepID=A0A4Y9Y5F9_9AGAM|nr:hypothetical protein EVG20_g8653 [Dentipellis fragilis]
MLSPISYLPDELLLYIFSLLVPRISSLDPFSPRLMDSFQSWKVRQAWMTVLHVLQVCQHWRRVALASASLWTTVDFHVRPFWTDFTLAHSQAAPLQIMTNHVHHFGERDMDRVSSNLHRIDAICIYPDPSSAEQLFSRLAGSAPLLHTLWLGTFGGIMTAPPFLRTEVFSRANAPRLKDVALANFVISWTPSFFTHLTRLTFCHPNLNFYPRRVQRTHEGLLLRPSLTELLDIFEEMSLIEDLTLLWVLPTDASPRSNPRLVHLPRLSSLCLAGTPEEISTCVHHIECPTSHFTALFTPMIWDADLAQQCGHLSDCIKHHMSYSGPKLPLIDEVTIFIGVDDLQLVAADSHCPKNQVDFTVMSDDTEKRNNLFQERMSILNLHSVALSRLSINLKADPARNRSGVTYWDLLFKQGCLRHAQHLELNGTELFSYLAQPSRLTMRSRILDTFPDIRTIAICDVELGGPFPEVNNPSAVKTRMDVRESLHKLLQGSPIRRLAFRNCSGATTPWLQSLLGEFPDIIQWDGDTEAACIVETEGLN